MRDKLTPKIEKHENNKKQGNPNWVKGQSGNPNGRPKKIVSLTSELKTQLTQVCPYDAKGRNWLQYLVDRWLAMSAENATYFRELIERLEGKVTLPIGGDKENPLQVDIDAGKRLEHAINRLIERVRENPVP